MFAKYFKKIIRENIEKSISINFRDKKDPTSTQQEFNIDGKLLYPNSNKFVQQKTSYDHAKDVPMQQLVKKKTKKKISH